MKTKNKSLEKKAKNLLWERDLNVSALARKIKRSRTWTSQVLYGHAKSEGTRQEIAKVLGAYIWPKAA